MRTCAQCSREKPPNAFPPRRPPRRSSAPPPAGLGARTLARATTTGRLRTIRVGTKRYTTARWVAMWHAAWREDGADDLKARGTA